MRVRWASEPAQGTWQKRTQLHSPWLGTNPNLLPKRVSRPLASVATKSLGLTDLQQSVSVVCRRDSCWAGVLGALGDKFGENQVADLE